MLNGVSPLQLTCFDIEKPDLIQLYSNEKLLKEDVFASHPVINNTKCRYCGVCADFCTDRALQFNRYIPSVTLIVARCSACGRCFKNCTRNGIRLKPELTGKLISFDAGDHRFIAGELDENSEFRVPLIQALLSRLDSKATVVCDFGPGDSNDVRTGLSGMDIAVILVQHEAQWKHKLEAMLEMAKSFNLSCGIILNKDNKESDFVNELIRFTSENYIPLLGIIPLIAQRVPVGLIGESANPGTLRRAISEIWQRIYALVPSTHPATINTSK